VTHAFKAKANIDATNNNSCIVVIDQIFYEHEV
jgi:hypothetical protein